MSRWMFADWHNTDCHDGPIEVVPNLYCGSMKEALVMVSEEIGVDTLVPLDSLDACIWKLGFRGEILYYPIEDYGVLPNDVLDDLVSKIIRRLKSGKKVGLFCLGGHGRTGYIASIVLGELGYRDPIGYLRSRYCRRAVESSEQIYHIAEALRDPELVDKYIVSVRSGLTDSHDLLYSSFGAGSGEEGSGAAVCGKCLMRSEGKCWIYGQSVDEDEPACEDFIENGE